jgi:hypothetical protein
MTKTLNQIIFFPPPKSEYFFQQHWESEYFFRKKNVTPLEVKWSVPYDKIKVANGIQQSSYFSFFWSGVCVFWQICKVLKGLSNSRGKI